MIHDAGHGHDDIDESEDRPSFARVETFLSSMDERARSARRTRFIAVAVGATIAGVAFLTAIGIVPVEAENVVLSASVVAAGFALGPGSNTAPPL